MRQIASIYRRRISRSSGIHAALAILLSKDTATALERLYYKKDSFAVKKAIRSIKERPSQEFLVIKNAFLRGNSFTLKTLQLIACGSCMFELTGVTRPPITTKYPEGNSHAQCIALVGRLKSKAERDFYIADLFYTELMQYNIFNADLFGYLASIQTDRLFARLLSNQFNTIKALIQ
jgi:hypothetical protein